MNAQIQKKQDTAAGPQREKITNKSALYNYVNINLLLVKCNLIKQDQHLRTDESVLILTKVRQRLHDTIAAEVRDVKRRLTEVYKERLEQHNPGGQGEYSRSESHTQGGKGARRARALSHHDLRWLLSAYGLIAAFF